MKEVATLPTGPAGVRGNRDVPTYVQVPTLVVLDWPQHQFKMEMKLRRPAVNESLTDAEAAQLFTRPAVRGVTPVNLAEAPRGGIPSGARGATPGERSGRIR